VDVTAKRAAAATSRKQRVALDPGASRPAQSRASRARRAKPGTVSWRYRALELLLVGALAAALFLGVLGRLARQAAPGLLVASLAAAAVASAALVMASERLRGLARGRWRHAINAGCIAIAASLVWLLPPTGVLQTLEELLASERATQLRVIRHQVFAAYRRMNLQGQQKILERSRTYEDTIDEAARTFGVDRELLFGIAATESSFHPRLSRDGGQGLFQITVVPGAAEVAAKKELGVSELDPVNHRHNAFVAAATLALYGKEMQGDLLLTLLAYNIGPRNGGLRFILDRYGARNFAQAQPYLQELPRDYPIRVLSAAFAYRIWRGRGSLPRYDEGSTAKDLQRVGIPGLDKPGWLARFFGTPF
jgi:soluble lytic murein transglycosylase-like protein